MSELENVSLAERYRPKRFKQLVGQEQAIAKVDGLLKKKRLPGSLLITGYTGSGKTTVSQMIARYVNCATMDACGKCDNCKMPIDNHPDYEQINCPTQGGKDDMRALIMRARNKPRMGNVRIIHLDEAHEITSGGEQALLLPLEKPPAQTLFILSTTDPQKLKKTLKDRCMSINLQLVPDEKVKDRLAQICEKEGLKLPSDVMDRIIELGAGYMRSSIRLVEACQVALSSNPKLKSDALIEIVNQDAQDGNDVGLDDLVIKVLIACLVCKTKDNRFVKHICTYLTDIKSDSVLFCQKACWLIQFLMDQALHKGSKHPNIWWSPLNIRFKKGVESNLKNFDVVQELSTLTSLLYTFTQLRQQLVSGGVSSIERSVITSTLAQWALKGNKK
jgi:DNA polymerase III subunit gamma/tau